MSTGLQTLEENQPVQMTKGDVQRLLTFAVEQVKEMTMIPSASGRRSRSIAELKLWAEIIRSAGMIPAQKEGGKDIPEATLVNRAIAKIVMGDQWDIDEFSSQSLFHFIPVSGTIVPDYKALLARIAGSGKYRYKLSENSDTRCAGTLFELVGEKWIERGEVEYTIEQAKNAGLYSEERALEKVIGKWPDGNPKVAKKGAWEAHTSVMLLSKWARRVFNLYCGDLYFLGGVVRTAEDYEEEILIDAAPAPQQITEADEPFFTNEPEAQLEPEPEAEQEYSGPAVDSEESNIIDLRAAIDERVKELGGPSKLTKDSRLEYERLGDLSLDETREFWSLIK